MSSRAEWDVALMEAEDGHPLKLARLTRNGVPMFASERLAAYIGKSRVKNTGRKPERNAAGHTHKRERQADAYELCWKLIETAGKSEDEAIAIASKDIPEAPPNVLIVAMRHGVKPVTDILRARGSLRSRLSKA